MFLYLIRFTVTLIFCISLLNLVFAKSINIYVKFDSKGNFPSIGKFVCLSGHFQWCSDYLYVDYNENINNINLININDSIDYEFIHNYSFFVNNIDIRKVLKNSHEYKYINIIKIKFQQYFIFRVINFFITAIFLFFILLITFPNFNYLLFFNNNLKNINR